MGDRAQVYVDGEHMQSPVWLYTHWGGANLPDDVRGALLREERWGDASYLARIVFDAMSVDDKSTTGYGLSTSRNGDVYAVIGLDCTEQELTLEQYSFGGGHEVTDTFHFEDVCGADRLTWDGLDP